jgi:nucleoside-diphosphate-sugar epimerase
VEDLVIDAGTKSSHARRRVTASTRVLVTGADGYIGSVLAPVLVERGFDVVGLDSGFYSSGLLYHDGNDRPPILNRDVRRLTPDDLRGYDAVVHLAELSNDPLCEFSEEMTLAINHRGSITLAEAAKKAGVRRFVYASSCSVYGAAGEDMKGETSPSNPQTVYARVKVMVERDVGRMAGPSFCPTYLRNATAFGASPRMRFDIVLNNLAGLAWTTGRITMTSDGTAWRPLVHVLDIAEAVVQTLEAPREAVFNEVFNVGDDSHNYTVRQISAAIADEFPGCAVEFGQNTRDNRSYRVSFAKIGKHLPGFRCRWTAGQGARQLRQLFEHIGLTAEGFQSPPFTRLRQLKHLLTTGQVDEELFWRLGKAA